MGIDCLEDDDIPAAATSSGEGDADRVTADETSADEMPGEAIDTNTERTADVPDEPAALGPELVDEVSRHEYHAEYRAKVDAVYLADARERWEEVEPGFQEEWRQYKKDHPAPPNVDPEASAEVEQGCKGILEIEENIVTPAMVRVAGEDPERWLVGFEFRCKGKDRIMEKVAEALDEQSDLSPSDALASVKDAVRYTFQYSEQHYTEGVYADSDRLKAAGFELVELRNSWRSEEYKGINSRWRVPDGGQLFEVQFHTAISFEAKQLTHQAYERIRNPATPDAQVRELRAFQRKVNTEVPHPSGAMDIPEHP